MSFKHPWVWAVAGALWTGLAIAVSCYLPGPGGMPELPPQRPVVRQVAPPVVGKDSGYISITNDEGSARVFWTLPDDEGRVKMNVELPGNE